MGKKYFVRVVLLCAIVTLFFNKASAQYAQSGTADPKLVRSVYWLTFGTVNTGYTGDGGLGPDGTGSTLIQAPAGYLDGSTPLAQGQDNVGPRITEGLYRWQFSPTVQITANISSIRFPNSNQSRLGIYTPGGNAADRLNYMFSAAAPGSGLNTGIPYSAISSPYSGTAIFNIAMDLLIKINGLYVSTPYPGVVMADGETVSSGPNYTFNGNSAASGEFFGATAENNLQFQLLSKLFVPVTNSQTQAPYTAQDAADYKLIITNHGNQFVVRNDVGPGNVGVGSVFFVRGGKAFNDVTMHGEGLTSIAFGFIVPFDLGDNPASYGFTGNYINAFDFTDVINDNGTYSIIPNVNAATVAPKATIFIGDANVDGDGQQLGNANSDIDETTGVNDENTYNSTNKPTIRANQDENIILNIPSITNNETSAGKLYVWVDLNGDGKYTQNEAQVFNVPTGTSSQNNITYLNSNFKNTIKVGPLYARFRVTTTDLTNNLGVTDFTTSDPRSLSYAANGETEDYRFDVSGLSIKGTIYDDGNGGTDAIGGNNATAIQKAGTAQLFVYLVNGSGVLINKATVATDGTYSLNNVDNGTYTVAVSTADLTVGSTANLANNFAALPVGYAASGADYGLHNGSGTGVQTGSPNLQISVQTPYTSQDVTALNFGINQAPIAKNFSGTAGPGNTIIFDVAPQATDADGTVVATSVQLIDPGDPTNPTNTVTFNGIGTYTVDPTNGKISFAAANGFNANNSPSTINYIIKDNFGTSSIFGSAANQGLITITYQAGPSDDSGNTPINTPTTTDVRSNDGGTNGTAVVNLPNANSSKQGTVVNDGANKVIYTPPTNFIGIDSYTYSLTANGLTSAPATVTITVKPVGVNDAYSTAVSTPVINDVKTNDGPSGNNTTVVVVSLPAHGTATGNSGALSTYFTYTPTTGYIGTDTYTYTLNTSDGAVSDPIIVTINIVTPGVNGTNDADITKINTPKVVNVKANDGATFTNAVVTPSATTTKGGILSVDGNNNIIYTPPSNFVGIDTYTYTLTKNDGTLTPNITVTMTVKPVGARDAYATSVNTAITNRVLDNDGPSGLVTSASTVTSPTHGTASLINNIYTYTPTTGYVGTDVFTYKLTTTDGNNISSDPITVLETITTGNSLSGTPNVTGTPDNDVTTAGTAKTTNVRANDGSQFASAVIAIAAQPANGTATIGTNGNVIYTPTAGFTGKDTYTYTLTNSGGTATTPITVTISVRPVGVNDNFFTTTNNAVANDVKANDGTNSANTVKILNPPTFGTITVASDNKSFTYTPANGFNGTDTYTYDLVTPDGVQSAQITVLDIIAPNGTDDTDVTTINTAKATTVKANDGSTYANATVIVSVAPAHGTTTVDNNGVVTYTPSTGYIGKDTYKYTLTKPGGTAGPAITVNISVKPVGVDDTYYTGVNTPSTEAVKANDGASATGTTVSIITAPTHGTATVDANGVVTYTPTTGYTGPTDAYTYKLTTADGVASDVINVTVNITTGGSPDDVTTLINTPITTDVKVNDGTNYTNATVTPTPTTTNGGTAVNDGADKVIYNPAPNFIGKDSYTYTLTIPGGSTSAPVTVNVTVKPIGVNDIYSTAVGVAVNNDVKTNDGPSANGTTIAVFSGPAHGAVAGNNGTASTYFIYTPTAGFVGSDTYTYKLKTADGIESDPITVTINIVTPGANGSNDADVTKINTSKVTNVKANDGATFANAVVTPSPTTLKGGTTANDGSNNVIYTPANNFIGLDSYTYTLTNNGGSPSSNITVTMAVKPVGTRDMYNTTVGSPITNSVKDNDGPSATNTTVSVVTAPAHGTVTPINTNTAFTYTPTAGYVGTDTYTYKLITTDGVSSDPITVVVSIASTSTGGTPNTTGNPDVDATLINTSKTTNVKANDGSQFSASTIAIATQPAHGTVTNNNDGTITYAPTTGFTGKDTYTYTLTTGGTTSTPVTVSISVAPVGVNDSYITGVNQLINSVVASNDGASGSVASGNVVRLSTPATYGSVAVGSDNRSFNYTPANNFVGTDTYAYVLVTPDGVVSAPINVTVTVSGNGAPDTYITPINTASTEAVKSNDGSAYTNATVAIATQPAHGTTAVDANGVVTYTPTTGYTGKDSYTYTLTNSGGSASAPITVNVSVKPVGVSDLYATTVNTPVQNPVKNNDGASGSNAGTTLNIVTAPTNGTAVVAGNIIGYSPTTGFTGTDTYTYSLTTADGVVSDPVTVNILIYSLGAADIDNTTINTAINTDVKANDGSTNANATVTPNSPTTKGGIVVNDGANKVTYTPPSNFTGQDTYTYTLTNTNSAGTFVSSPITVTINVHPVGVNDSYSTSINTPIVNNVKANDGASANGTTVIVGTNAAHGTVVGNNGTSSTFFTYTPTTGYTGTDSYTYTLNTTDGVASAPITVNITVVAASANGNPDNDVTTINTAKTTNVKANDGPTFTNAVVTPTNSAHGTTAVDGNGNVIYTPASNFIGVDTYTYTLTNSGGSPSAAITVTINVKPVGVDDTYSTSIGTLVFNDVKSNDGASATGTTVAIATGPLHGTAVPNSTNTAFNYTPTAGYIGTDTYTYKLTTADNVSSDPVTVTVNISSSTGSGGSPNTTGTTDNDVTVLNTPKATTVKANDGTTFTNAVVTPANGNHGTTTADANGIVTYTPAQGYTGKDIYTYTLTQSGATTTPVTVNITVKPIGVNDNYFTPVNVAVQNPVTTNDGVSGSNIGTTVRLVTPPTYGAVVVNTANTIFTYTPANNFTGTDTYTYALVTADGVMSDAITVSVSVSANGNPDTYSTPVNTTSIQSVKTNDGAAYSNATVVATQPAHGTTTVDANGVVTYKPTTGYVGKDTYTYTLTQSGSTGAAIAVNVNVTPVAINDTYSTTVNASVNYSVKSNDNGTTGTTISVLTNPSNGTISTDVNGVTTYTPANNFAGTDTYTYALVTADAVQSNTATVTIVVSSNGQPDSYTTPINTASVETVKNNDGSAFSNATVNIATQPAHGSITSIDANGVVTYKPVTGYTGKDSYTYTLTLPGGSPQAPITVSINVKPVGVNDTYSTTIGAPIANTVKNNDGASGSNTGTTLAVVTNPTNGTATVSGNLINYTPVAGYSGTDTYTYTLTTADGVVSDPITVNIIIYSNGSADLDNTVINTPITTDVRANDGTTNANATVTPSTTTTKGGTAVNDGSNKVTYTPPSNFSGRDTYTYTLTNGSLISSPITVTINVKPVGVNDAYSTSVNTPIINDVKANDGAGANGTTVVLANSPVHGTAVGNNGGASTYFTYTPNTNFIGTDTYTYLLVTTDGNNITSSPITVTINVPTPSANGNADVDVTTINTSKTTNVKANDGAVYTGATVTPTPTTTKGGTTAVDGNGNVIYTPANNFIGVDTYTYTLTPPGGTAQAPVNVTVNVKPIGVNDAYSTAINTAVPNDVKSNDGASALGTTVSVVTTSAHGSVVTTNNNTAFNYTPTTGYTGTDTYTYKLTTTDGVSSDPIIVTINISTSTGGGGSSSTTGTTDNDVTVINTPKATNVKANDGANFATATVTPTSGTHGTTAADANGIVTYTPTTGFTGKDSYTYSLNTNGTVSAPVIVNIVVKPIGVADNYTTPINTAIQNTVLTNDGASGQNNNTVRLVTPPTYGSVILNSSNTVFTYTPATGFTGTDTYTYAIVTSPDGVLSDPITVGVVVSSNGFPDSYITNANTASTESVKSNDGTANTNAIVTATQAAHGTTAVDANGIVTYTPANGYTGKDAYTYTLTQNGLTGTPINVSITVKPVAVNDNYNTAVNTPVTYKVKDNDIGTTGNTISVLTNVSNGTLSVDANGVTTYTPNASFTGTDSYTYSLVTPDGVTSNGALVTINVNSAGTADNDVTTVNTAKVTDVKANDGTAFANATVTPASPTTKGGTTTVDNTGKVVYTPPVGFTGKDTYTYTLNNNGTISAPILVTITVKPVGTPDNIVTSLNTSVITDVKANDGASANGTTVTAVTNPAHGTLTPNSTNTAFTYTPATGYTGADTYTYALVTADGVSSDPVTVNIAVASGGLTLLKTANNGAAAVGDVINYTLKVTNTGTDPITNVKVADAGADAGSISPAIVAVLGGGASANVIAKHTVTTADVAAGSYSNQASVTATDAAGNTISKLKSDDPATAAVDDPTVVKILPKGAITLVKTGVSDFTSVTFTFTITNTGSVAVNNISLTDALLNITNSPVTVAGGLAPGAKTTVTFKYTLLQADRDAAQVINTATVNATDANNNTVTSTNTVNVAVPPSPKALPDPVSTTVGGVITFNPSKNDQTSGAAFVAIEILVQPQHGKLVINPDLSVTYTPDPGYNGPDSFTYRLRDVNGFFTNSTAVAISDGFVNNLRIPNTFTPNGDGINDAFEILGIEAYPINELIIINRWGNEVYHKTNYTKEWTGEGLNEGTYYFLLHLKNSDGSDLEVIKGYVTLIRSKIN